MKKYFIVFLILSIMTITSVTNADFPVECANTINAVMKTMKEFEGKTLPLDPSTWGQFKDSTRKNGSWENTIVPACCKPCSDTGCKTCSCDGIDPCTWHCRCCWGLTACSSLPD